MSGRREPRTSKTISHQTRERLKAWLKYGLIDQKQYNLAFYDEFFRRCLVTLAEDRQDPERKKWLAFLGCDAGKFNVIMARKTVQTENVHRQKEPEPRSRLGTEIPPGKYASIPVAGTTRTMIHAAA